MATERKTLIARPMPKYIKKELISAALFHPYVTAKITLKKCETHPVHL